MVCVCVFLCVKAWILFGTFNWNVQQVNVNMFRWCLTWVMYELMKFRWGTKHIESMCKMYCKSSLVCWNMVGKATLKQ